MGDVFDAAAQPEETHRIDGLTLRRYIGDIQEAPGHVRDEIRPPASGISRILRRAPGGNLAIQPLRFDWRGKNARNSAGRTAPACAVPR